ncbi:MAG: hypothetical protein KGJ60_10165 [Verrucomicrobiota bacterium]|nr:hypothetical protein [Verrucomicrobiota bacterium]
MKMKWHVFTIAAATSAMLLTGCESPNGTPDNTGTGALLGGAIGALAGAAISGPNHAGEGALIGAASGLIGGGLIGHAMDQQQAEVLQRQAPQTYVRVEQGQPLGLADIKALAKAGVSDDVIISQIRGSQTVFHLSSADIIDLHENGVSDRVIDFMINTPNTEGVASNVTSSPATTTTIIETPPPPPPVEPVLVAPGPGSVWIDGEWNWDDDDDEWVWTSGHWVYPPYAGAIWIHGDWDDGPDGWCHRPGRWR